MLKKTRITAYLLLSSLILLASSSCASAATWQPLTTVQGSASQTTDYIYVPSGEWRISWSYTATQYPDSAVFAYSLKDVEGKQRDALFTSGTTTTSGTSYLHEGPGNYYFDITTNVDSYSIKIEYQQETHTTTSPILDELRGNSDLNYLLISGIAATIFIAVAAILIIKKKDKRLPPPP